MSASEKEAREEKRQIRKREEDIRNKTIKLLREKLLYANKPYCSREEVKRNLQDKMFGFNEKWLFHKKGLYADNWLYDYLNDKSCFGPLSTLRKADHKGNIYYKYRYKWLARITSFLYVFR